jgi:tubulin polyglutamylase TTLL6/13
MSDEEDYSTDESSADESTLKLTSNSKPKELSLAENDDDYDIKAFHRPDLNDIDGEGEYDYEEDGEDEESEFDASTLKQKSSKTNQKSNKINLKRSESSGTNATNSRMEIDKQSAQIANKIKKKKKPLFICLVATKYECVHRVAKKLNFKEVGEDEDWFLYWTDTSVSIDRVNQMKRWQKINHFPGMSEICRKDFLTRNMNRMAKLFPKEYSFYPKAWCLPAE